MICPSWLSSSTILLMMSSRFGSFNTPVAFGSTWIVKSFTKEHCLIKVQINYLQLILCWVEAELPEDVSQKFGLHLTSGRGVKLFERFLESFSFGLPPKKLKDLILKNLSLTEAPLFAWHCAADQKKRKWKKGKSFGDKFCSGRHLLQVQSWRNFWVNGEPCQQLGGYKTVKTPTEGKMSIEMCKNGGYGKMHVENSFCMQLGNPDSNPADDRCRCCSCKLVLKEVARPDHTDSF